MEPEPIPTDRQSLAAAALVNDDIRDFMADPALGRVWTEDAMRRCPVCRNEWEHVTVIATTGEAHSAAKHKNWGRFIGVAPLARDDPVHPYRILYCYKSASPYNRRVEQRRALKRILGRGYRPLVTRASRSTKKDFLKTLTPDQTQIIRLCFRIDPGRFWRAAKGREFLDLPRPPRQLTLFDIVPDPEPPSPEPEETSDETGPSRE